MFSSYGPRSLRRKVAVYGVVDESGPEQVRGNGRSIYFSELTLELVGYCNALT
jgi:hypothetical protein